MVRERTYNLEKIRDSVSEYAVQKSELAQELEEKNQEILRQKDDLFKQSEKLKDAYEEIKKLEAYRQQMARMIIHDLKNPLNLILNIAESDDIPSKSGKLIRKLSWGMLDLIMNILEVDKLENMRMKIVMTSFDLAAALNRMLEKFSFILASSGVTLRSDIVMNTYVYADFLLTGRILDNLISNAIKYSSSGGIISISSSEVSDEIRIEIRDNGAGIPQNIMKEVFNEYVHGENRSFAYSNPTGIGLAYCKLAVEAMQGKIGIASTEGEGTLVWFSLKKGYSDVCNDDVSINNVTGENDVSRSLPPELSNEEAEIFKTFIVELKKVEPDEVSAIMKILDDKFFDSNEKLKVWKDKILETAFKGNSNAFEKLTNITDYL
jgi:signal transduction histidine kinase